MGKEYNPYLPFGYCGCYLCVPLKDIKNAKGQAYFLTRLGK